MHGQFFNSISDARSFVVQSMADMSSSYYQVYAELFNAMQGMSSLEELKTHLCQNKFMYATPELALHHELLDRIHHSRTLASIGLFVPKHMVLHTVSMWNDRYGLTPYEVKELSNEYFVQYKGDQQYMHKFARTAVESGEATRYHGGTILAL